MKCVPQQHVPNLISHGKKPHSVVIIHGGPGLAGEMAPVAKELSASFGILEPLQTATSFEGQVHELHAVLEKHAQYPVCLIGHSWGAFLAFVLTARYPSLVRKLILVGSPPYEEKYAASITETRMARLNAKEKEEMKDILRNLQLPTIDDEDMQAVRLEELLVKADNYDPEVITHHVKFDIDIYQAVWPKACAFRNSGELLLLGKLITCPVIAIHGDYDPHPGAGVKGPLAHVVKKFRFVSLKNCGHDPWRERQAKDEFFRILRSELTS